MFIWLSYQRSPDNRRPDEQLDDFVAFWWKVFAVVVVVLVVSALVA